MRALDRKLVRDLSGLRTQSAAIALVIASAVAAFVGTVSAYRALVLSQAQYYDQNRFAHVWVRLTRAPHSIVREIAALPGVAAAEGRVVADVILDLPGVVEPVTALLVSIPAGEEHSLNDLHIRRGRHPEASRADEVLVNEPFAVSNNLQPGDRLHALMGGRRVELHIVGIALSPEHVMQVPPSASRRRRLARTADRRVLRHLLPLSAARLSPRADGGRDGRARHRRGVSCRHRADVPSVAALLPVVAMTAPAPVYRPTWLDRRRWLRPMPPAARMIVRNVSRRPVRAALTAGAMSLAVAILGLGHDFRVTVAVDVWHGEDRLTVPSTALFRTADRWAVFVVRDGRAHLTTVSAGRSDRTRTVVEDGLDDGQVVVIQPSDLLRDGARIAEVSREP